jgi:hypothetical protein
MVPLTQSQRRRRALVEHGISLAAPALDALLWAGDRLSRIVERDDPSYDPPRSPAPDSPVRRGAPAR